MGLVILICRSVTADAALYAQHTHTDDHRHDEERCKIEEAIKQTWSFRCWPLAVYGQRHQQ